MISAKYYLWFERPNGEWVQFPQVYDSIEKCRHDNALFIMDLEEKGLCYKFYEAKPYKGN